MSDYKDHWWYKEGTDYEPMFDVQFSKVEETSNTDGKPVSKIIVTVATRHIERLQDKSLRRWSENVSSVWDVKESFLYAIHKPIDDV